MSKYDVYQKTSWEQKDFDLSFDKYLAGTSDQIDTFDVEVENSDLVKESQSVYPVDVPRIVKVLLSAGVNLQAYKVKAKAVCVSGRKLEHTIVIVIVD
jgi:hypothetical protein